MAFGDIFLHNKLDKTYQAGHFHKKKKYYFNFLVKTYYKSATSSPIRFWHFKCIKYANTPSSKALQWSVKYGICTNLVLELTLPFIDHSVCIFVSSEFQVKPTVNQVNLASCCVMPPELVKYAGESDIQLLTHNDPKSRYS
jgi:hypothetical protein